MRLKPDAPPPQPKETQVVTAVPAQPTASQRHEPQAERQPHALSPQVAAAPAVPAQVETGWTPLARAEAATPKPRVRFALPDIDFELNAFLFGSEQLSAGAKGPSQRSAGGAEPSVELVARRPTPKAQSAPGPQPASAAARVPVKPSTASTKAPASALAAADVARPAAKPPVSVKPFKPTPPAPRVAGGRSSVRAPTSSTHPQSTPDRGDPLAPLKTMTEAERIALFS
jgi:hypothetical protein